ncbi:DUF2125 domain-containing protein [Pseudooceanicola spongiae]|uniref:DUF2125 domain-containing protein n=1 Tax=Pseudooceanicola spongiae TaxID=2613965 RepID=A0A7L9WRS3_9RHOB|nr:DUF2125 domain-containing protein [Pseudooceanicola spongiae]QOL82544.1 DUF2125 domain-containing protein [Pseudooceanicola spongiae]
MKRLVIVILAAAALWSGYWFIAAHTEKRALTQWFAARRAEGWQADYAGFTVQGYPNRLDAIWTDMALADPATGVALDLPKFALMALSYQPNHVIAVAPKTMLLRTPQDSYPISNDDLRASLRLHAGPSLQLDRAQLSADKLVLAGPQPASLDHLSLAVSQHEDDERTYRLGLLASGLTPPEVLRNRVTSGMALPDQMQEARLDATVTFDKPWDISAINRARPQPRHITVALARAEWGALALQIAADLAVDEAGQATGDVSLQARNWRQMVQAAVAAGALDASVASIAETTLGLMARMGGNSETLDVTLSLRDGRVYLGPISLGPAPVFRLR